MWILHETSTNKEALWPVGKVLPRFGGGGGALLRESITMIWAG